MDSKKLSFVTDNKINKTFKEAASIAFAEIQDHIRDAEYIKDMLRRFVALNPCPITVYVLINARTKTFVRLQNINVNADEELITFQTIDNKELIYTFREFRLTNMHVTTNSGLDESHHKKLVEGVNEGRYIIILEEIPDTVITKINVVAVTDKDLQQQLGTNVLWTLLDIKGNAVVKAINPFRLLHSDFQKYDLRPL